MENKLCVGDIVRLKDGTIGLVNSIDCYDADGDLVEIETILGNGLPLKEVNEFSIIRNNHGQTAWFSVKDYVCTESNINNILESLNDVPDGKGE